MQKNSTAYIFIFALVITLVCGVGLAMVSEGTAVDRAANVKVEKMANILATVNVVIPKSETYNSDVEAAYSKMITEVVVDMHGNIIEGEKAFDVVVADEKSSAKNNPEHIKKLPVFIYSNEEGNNFYVVPVTGNGLWGAIWGYVGLSSDFSTVYGVKFDHVTETPGLGAEITKEWFQDQFRQKKTFNEKQDKVVLTILKGKGNKLDETTVDGISGATITSKGVDNMLKKDMAEYIPYFMKNKKH